MNDERDDIFTMPSKKHEPVDAEDLRPEPNVEESVLRSVIRELIREIVCSRGRR